MRISISNEIIVYEANDDMKLWAKNNLVYRNPEYAKRRRMGLYCANIPKTLQMYKEIGHNLVLPFGVLNRIWDLIKGNPISVNFKMKKIYPKSSITLYDYQEEAVKRMMKAKNGILISKAGSGKTMCMLEIICRLGYKALWINNKKELVNQALDRAKANIQNCSFGLITEGKVDIQDITFATIQTLCRIDLSSIKDEFGIIIIDEFQNITGTPTIITQYYSVLSKLSARYKIGCTACLHRSDGLTQAGIDLVGEVAYEVPESAIADKIIKAKIIPYKIDYTLPSEILSADGILSSYATLITSLANDEKRNTKISKLILEQIKKRQTLYCPFR